MAAHYSLSKHQHSFLLFQLYFGIPGIGVAGLFLWAFTSFAWPYLVWNPTDPRFLETLYLLIGWGLVLLFGGLWVVYLFLIYVKQVYAGLIQVVSWFSIAFYLSVVLILFWSVFAGGGLISLLFGLYPLFLSVAWYYWFLKRPLVYREVQEWTGQE